MQHAAALAAVVLAPGGSWVATPTASASKLGPAVDRAWEAMGGGPSDLTFPAAFLGEWDVTSVLQQVELPLGPEMVPGASMEAIQRARAQDLGQPLRYKVVFIRNREGQVVFDRAYNMASMLSLYSREPVGSYLSRIQWQPSDPNVLQLTLPGGMNVRTRVTRRSEEQPEPRRINTSEFLEQVIDSTNMSESSLSGLRVKASQCFTKYLWRDEAAAGPGQPSIVATQVVSDYLTPLDQNYLQTMNQPIAQWTYKLAFIRAPLGGASSPA